MQGRTGGLILTLLLGVLLGAMLRPSIFDVATAARDSHVRASQTDATRSFLQVPDGEIHVRAVPRTAAMVERGDAYPGTLGTTDDASHEFFREDTRQWFVDLVEVAVGREGTLTVEVVDRPAPEGTSGVALARLVLDVAPRQSILLGMGVEGIGARSITAAVWQNLLPDWAANEPQGGWDRARLPSVRVRLVGVGGRVRDASAPVATREYTRGSVRSAWGRANTMDQALASEVRASLDGLSFGWVPGEAHRFFSEPGHATAPVASFVNLGVLFWSPAVDTKNVGMTESRAFAEHHLGPVTVTMTNAGVALSVNGKPTTLDTSPYPLWVSRIRFEPAVDGRK